MKYFDDAVSVWKGHFGAKIPDGHLYLGDKSYKSLAEQEAEDKKQETRNKKQEIEEVYCRRIYLDQKFDTDNGKGLHGLLAFGFPEQSHFSLALYPEHSLLRLSQIFEGLGLEWFERDADILPLRAYTATIPRDLKKVMNSGVGRETAIDVNIRGRGILEANSANSRKLLQDFNLLQFGPEYMTAKQFGAMRSLLAEKGFLAPETVQVLEIFEKACTEYTHDNPNLNATRREMLAVYKDKSQGKGRGE